jgi:hypothetical protein
MQRLLQCLDCSFVDAVDLNDDVSVAKLVCWLEDRKIREYEISERSGLRVISEKWNDEISGVQTSY